MPTVRSWLRPLYLLLGLVSLGIALIGIFLPLIPTTGPVLLAAFFFARSSERLHSWILDHPRFGPFVRDFQEGRGIPLRGKIVAVSAMTLAFGYGTIFALSNLWARIAFVAVGVWAIWYVLHFPTAPARSAEESR
ncbi:MAG TPA: YbaN family protein [Acidimicrobiia bacterium]|nr:YbaN family protein [Acidimicrobiia bacterium]